MTTIIYDQENGEIASDSQETGNGNKQTCLKLFRVNGHIIGTAGSSYSGLLFVRWFKEWESEPDWDDRSDTPDLTNLSEDEDFECIVVRPDRSCYTINRLFVPYEMLKVQGAVALGSGAACALGAFSAGADVKEAIRIACKIDAHTSGRVQFMKMK